jgi:branched-chain amino acid transport system substrate-binding protein
MKRVASLSVLMLGCALVATGCGGRLTDAQILARSGVRGGAASGARSASTAGEDVGAGPSAAGGGTASGGPAGGAPGPAGTQSSAAAKGISSGNGAAGGGVGTPGETGPVMLGNVGTYSGPAGASTAGIPRAVQVWAAAVNHHGGLFGRQVQVIVQDDGGDPARFASAVQDLVENRHVIAFVGESTLGVQAGKGYLESKGIPVIGTDCSTVVWYQSADFFPQCAAINPDTAGLGLKAAVALTGKHQLGLVYCTETPVCADGDKQLVDAAGRRGVQVVYNASISLAQVDFTSNCQAAQNKHADLFVVIGDANTVSRFSQSCVRQSYRPQYVQPTITVIASTTSTPGLENVLVPSQIFAWAGMSSPAFQEFSQAMGTYAPSEKVGPASTYGWTAGKLFELAATKAAAATRSLNPKSLSTAMHTVRGETLGGLTVTLDFTGPRPNNAPCGFIIQADGSGGWKLPEGPNPYC